MRTVRRKNLNGVVLPYFSFMDHDIRNYINKMRPRTSITQQMNPMIDIRRDKRYDDKSIDVGSMWSTPKGEGKKPIIIRVPSLIQYAGSKYVVDNKVKCRLGVEKTDDSPYNVNQLIFIFHTNSDRYVLEEVCKYTIYAWVLDEGKTTLREMKLMSHDQLYNNGKVGINNRLKITLPSRLPVIKRLEIEFDFSIGGCLILEDIVARGTHFSGCAYGYTVDSIEHPYNQTQCSHIQGIEAIMGYTDKRVPLVDANEVNTTIDVNVDGYKMHPYSPNRVYQCLPDSSGGNKDHLNKLIHSDIATIELLNTNKSKIHFDTEKYISYSSVPSSRQYTRDMTGTIDKLHMLREDAGVLYSSTDRVDESKYLVDLSQYPTDTDVTIHRYALHNYYCNYGNVYRNVAYIETQDGMQFAVLGHWFIPEEYINLANEVASNIEKDNFERYHITVGEPNVGDESNPESCFVGLILRPITPYTFNKEERVLDVKVLRNYIEVDRDFRYTRTDWVLPWVKNNVTVIPYSNGMIKEVK